MSAPAFINIQNLSVGYTSQSGEIIRVLRDVSLSINRGESIGLVGESGSGKSTLALAALGFFKRGLRALEGDVEFDGIDMLALERDDLQAIRGGRLALIPQNSGQSLTPTLRIGQQVAEALRLHSQLDESDFEARVVELLTQVRLPEPATLVSRFPHELSGGQQQRVALARALAPKPSVILLDEPYAGLDSRLRERIRDEMLHVLKAANAVALMVTHDAEEAMFMSDRIVVLRDGKMVQSGRPVNLYCQPNSAFVAEFFGEVNRVEGTVANKKVTTPLGDFDAPDGLHNGHQASVIIRHEALFIDPGNDGVIAEVMESRLLGRASLIHLSVPTGRDEIHLHARIPGLNSIEVGSQVRVRVDPSQAFVFQAGAAAD